MRSHLHLLIILMVCSVVSSAAAQDKPVVRVAAISIAVKDPDSQFGQSLAGFRTAGLEVDLHIRVPGRTVLSLDQKVSTMTLATGDGTPLPLADGFDGVMSLSLNEDRSTGILRMRSDTLPPAGTTALSAKGTLVFVVGESPETKDLPLTIAQGSRIRLGAIDAEVSEVGDAFGEPFKKTITFSAKKPMDTVAKIEFLDAKGTAIESASGGSGNFGFGDDVTYSQSHQVASDADKLQIRVTYFSKTSTVKLPADLKFGLGL